MKKLMFALLASFSALLAFAAPTPTVWWNGDFSTAEKTGTDGVKYTLAETNGVYTVTPEAATNTAVSVLVKYSGLKAITDAAPTLIGFNVYQNSENNQGYIEFGIRASTTNSTTIAGWYGTKTYAPSSTVTAPEDGYVMSSFLGSSGTGIYAGELLDSLTGGVNTSLRFANTTVTNITVGGPYSSTSYPAWNGVEIESIALFLGSSVVATNDIADFEFDAPELYGWEFNTAGSYASLGADVGSISLACDGGNFSVTNGVLDLSGTPYVNSSTTITYSNPFTYVVPGVLPSAANTIYLGIGHKGSGAYVLATGTSIGTITLMCQDTNSVSTAVTGDYAVESPTKEHLYVLEADGTVLTAYVDGKVALAYTNTTEITTTNPRFQLGSIHGGAGTGVSKAASGQIDAVRIYGGRLSASQMAALVAEFPYDAPKYSVNGTSYCTLAEAVAAAGDGGKITVLGDLPDGGLVLDGIIFTASETDEKVYTVTVDTERLASTAALRFSEIMPKPSDKPYEITTQSGYDKNGLESGWVELENTSESWVDLKDYRFRRANRGKKYDQADYGNFPSVLIAPNSRFTFYTSERYSNSAPEASDGNTSAFSEGTFDGKPIWYGDMLIWGDKVNPKKYPMVQLVYAPEGTDETVIESVIVPSDTPEGYSIIVGHDEADSEATKRWLCPSPTFNAANPATDDLVKIGPNVGPKYGVKHSVKEFTAVPPAKSGEDYPVSLNVNPVYGSSRDADAIASVTLVYRTCLTNATAEVAMTKAATGDDGGDVWTAAIPHAAFDDIGPGELIQWKTKITDGAGNEWTSPSFMNKDDGYEWYGTITEPDEDQMAEHLATWHMFVDAASKAQMDVDADKQTLENNARVAIYDSSTSNYYDYVRIDLRGNTSASFNKKSHGLRFSKVHPMTMYDPVRKTTWEEIRKTSLIGEPADPSRLRQLIAFWLWNEMGNKVPFDFPVRCNLNGEFFQVGFNSERFTDELIEDVYGLDKYGYGYKNVGRMDKGLTTSAGSIDKKTPDDGNESDYTVLKNELTTPMYNCGVENGVTNNTALTKFAVEKFNLPAWLNYLASARITQEMDDVWANISAYYDDAQMLEGSRGTGTWMPLGYDFNLTFGQWYYNDVRTLARPLLMSNQDWFKSHPFYGGNGVRCYTTTNLTSVAAGWNRGIETVLQNEKFRRLYLRRLRTLMDAELGEPVDGETFETTTNPIIVKMKEVAALMGTDGDADREKYPWDSSIGNIDDWGSATNFPSSITAGIEEIYTSYIVPRREHFYVTHSVTNTAKEIGYGTAYNAGIPLAQSAIEDLKEKITAEVIDGGVKIVNGNEETIDMSGWTVSGQVNLMLPAGTVIDQAIDGESGELFVVTDRKSYIAANDDALTDEVIVGNASVGTGTDVGLAAADGTIVISSDVILAPGTYTDTTYSTAVTLAPAGEFEFKGVSFAAGVSMGEGTFILSNKNGYTNTASVVSAESANVILKGKGAFKLAGEKTSGTLMTTKDLIVSNGVLNVESKAMTAETAAVVVKGNFAVEDKGTVELKLTKNAASGRGIYLTEKKMFCRIGKGGTFKATTNGPSSQALKCEKGSVDIVIEDGATVIGEGNSDGTNVRFFKTAGNIDIQGGEITVELKGAGSEIFSSDKGTNIEGGVLELKTTDDCVSATGDITITGGTIVAESTADDALDSNANIAISGGTLILIAPNEGHEGLDCDPDTDDGSTHTLTITGGVVYSVGGKDCDLHEPDSGSQAYKVVESDSAAGYIAAKVGETVHCFAKPAGGVKTIVSLAELASAETVDAVSSEAETVVDGWYWTWAEATTEIEITPSAPVEVEAANEEAAAAAVTIVVPEECGEAGVEDATYRALFDVKATAVEGEIGVWSVAIALKAAVVEDVQPKLDAAAKAIVAAADGVADAASVEVETRAGLFYRVDTATGLEKGESGAIDWTKGEAKMGTGETLAVPVAVPAGAARAFFKVVASPVK